MPSWSVTKIKPRSRLRASTWYELFLPQAVFPGLMSARVHVASPRLNPGFPPCPSQDAFAAQVDGGIKRYRRKGNPRQALPAGWLHQFQTPSDKGFAAAAATRQVLRRPAAPAESPIVARHDAAPPRAATAATGACATAQPSDGAAEAAQCPAPQLHTRVLAAKTLTATDVTMGRVVVPRAHVVANLKQWSRHPPGR